MSKTKPRERREYQVYIRYWSVRKFFGWPEVGRIPLVHAVVEYGRRVYGVELVVKGRKGRKGRKLAYLYSLHEHFEKVSPSLPWGRRLTTGCEVAQRYITCFPEHRSVVYDRVFTDQYEERGVNYILGQLRRFVSGVSEEWLEDGFLWWVNMDVDAGE